MSRIKLFFLAFGVLVAVVVLPVGSASADPVFPADGASLALGPAESVEARFVCEPQDGGLTVEETADFVGAWNRTPAPPLPVAPGECAVTLYQFPSGSAAVDATPHVYYWRAWQCLYSGSCARDDIGTTGGPTWSFTIERPLVQSPAPVVVPSPPPVVAAPAPPPPVVEPPAQSAACVYAKATLRNVRGRLRGAVSKRDRRLVKRRRQALRRARRRVIAACS